MLKNRTDDLKSREITISPHAISVGFVDAPRFVRLSLPSLTDLEELKAFEFVITNNNEQNFLSDMYEKICLREYELLLAKDGKYEKSSTYNNRLANFETELSMHEEAEKRYKDLASRSDEDSYKVTLGNFLSTNSRKQEAYDVLLGCDLELSVEPNMRLAQISVGLKDFEKAKIHIADALRVNMFDGRARMFEGTLHLLDKKFQSAVRSFKIASEDRGKSSVLFANMALAYWALREKKQTIRSLKRSIALDPTNENATLFLADVYRNLRMPLESVDLLDKSAHYLQSSDAVWSRLGKAYLDLSEKRRGDKNCLLKALSAFSKQKLHSDSYDSWNNIGAVYSLLGKTAKAQRFFSQALVPREDDVGVSMLAMSNLLTTMIELKQYDEIVALVENVIKNIVDTNHIDHLSSKVALQYVIALEAKERRAEAASICGSILDRKLECREIRFDLLCRITYYLSVIEFDRSRLQSYLDSVDVELRGIADVNRNVVRRYVNNIVFSYLVIDEPVNGAKYLPRLSDGVSTDPYVMATLGLYHLKLDRIDRAVEMYKRAISTVQGKEAKDRFRQRMFYEIGIKKYKDADYKGSQRALRSAFKQSLGFDYVLRNVKRLSREVESKLKAA